MKKKVINSKKAVMIGCGFVGSASVFALMQSGLFTEIVLIDADKNKAEGEAMDISHGIPFASPMKIYAGDYDDVADTAIVVISAGAGQKPGETRLDLVNKNVAIFKSIIPEIAKRNFAGIMLVVANPVDILTQVAIKLESDIPIIAIPENNAKNSAPQSVNYCVTDFRRTPVRLQICSLQFALCSTAFFALFSGLAII